MGWGAARWPRICTYPSARGDRPTLVSLSRNLTDPAARWCDAADQRGRRHCHGGSNVPPTCRAPRPAPHASQPRSHGNVAGTPAQDLSYELFVRVAPADSSARQLALTGLISPSHLPMRRTTRVLHCSRAACGLQRHFWPGFVPGRSGCALGRRSHTAERGGRGFSRFRRVDETGDADYVGMRGRGETYYESVH
jgi:hypothetical protein